MDDDLNTPEALAGIFELVNRANRAADDGDRVVAQRLGATVAVLCGALGLRLHGDETDTLDEAAARLVAERDGARAAREWARADELRDQLEALGWTVEDSPQGTRLRR